MSNIEAIIAETKTRLKKYDTSGILDEDLMYTDVVSAMKAFGNDITTYKEDLIEIVNGKGKLPHDFYKLSEAILAEPYRCDAPATEYRTLVGLSFITDVKLLHDRWNECDNCCDTYDSHFIRKEQYISDSIRANVDYKKVKYLKLGKSFDKKYCLDNVRQQWHPNEKDEITIVGNEIRTNFQEGSIYIKYRGFHTDENGNIDVPDTPNGHLDTYLKRYVMNGAIEQLMINDESRQSLAPLLQYGEQKIRAMRHNAGTDLKSMNFSMGRLANKIIKNDMAYARMRSKPALL